MNKKSPSPAKRVVFLLAAVTVVCLCVGALVPGIRGLNKRQREIEALRYERQTRQDQILLYQREIAEMSTDAGIERVARDELNLVKPGETVFVFEKDPDDSDEPGPRTPKRRP